MLNILLIDDEYLILKGIESMLNHQQRIPVRVTPCLDSVEALEALPALNPDVVVLDINMPELDGLTFIDRALTAGFSGKFIIVSGYEDSAYLKRAFELHVADYIIKPINKQKLIDTLEKLHAQKLQTEQMMLTRLRFALTMADDSSGSEFSASDWQRLFPAPHCALLCLRCAPEGGRLSAVREQLESYFHPLYFFHYNFAEAFLGGMPHALKSEELAAIARACSVEPEMLPGCSEAAHSSDVFSALLNGQTPGLLLEAIGDSILRELARDGVKADRARPAFDVTRKIIQNAAHDRISGAYQAIFDDCVSPSAAFGRAFVEGATALIVRHAYQTYPRQLAQLYAMLRSDVSEDASPADSMMALSRRWLRLMDQSDDSGSPFSDKVGAAVAYIHTHFSEDVSLNDVADAVKLSPSYLSASFSREVGVSFVAYLKKTRMDEACRILEKHPRLSVKAVASRVGYQTVGQFYKVFKSVHRESPQSWREHHLPQSHPDAR